MLVARQWTECKNNKAINLWPLACWTYLRSTWPSNSTYGLCCMGKEQLTNCVWTDLAEARHLKKEKWNRWCSNYHILKPKITLVLCNCQGRLRFSCCVIEHSKAVTVFFITKSKRNKKIQYSIIWGWSLDWIQGTSFTKLLKCNWSNIVRMSSNVS